jgi:hypothetical protein
VFVSRLRAVTLACGITAEVESVTVPVMEAVCAVAKPDRQRARKSKIEVEERYPIEPPPGRYSHQNAIPERPKWL